MRDTCPNCGGSKNEDFDLCYDCYQSVQELDQEEVGVRYHKIVKETDKAFLAQLGTSVISPRRWFPKSLVSRDAEWLLMPRWFADKEGLDYEG